MATTLLTIDIGGTKCELAVFPVMKTVPGKPLVKKRYLSVEHSCLEDIVADLPAVAGEKRDYACAGVAGVVSGGVGTVTNKIPVS